MSAGSVTVDGVGLPDHPTFLASPGPRVESALAQAHSERAWGEDESWCGTYACSGEGVELPAGGDGR